MAAGIGLAENRRAGVEDSPRGCILDDIPTLQPIGRNRIACIQRGTTI